MTISIDLSPQTETRLREGAAHAGQALPDYVRNILEATTNSGSDQGSTAARPRRKLSELRGLGADLWRTELAGRDAQDYINEIRDEWERPA